MLGTGSVQPEPGIIVKHSGSMIDYGRRWPFSSLGRVCRAVALELDYGEKLLPFQSMTTANALGST